MPGPCRGLRRRLPPLAELIDKGKVLALNMPAGANPALAHAIGVLLKNAWMQALLRRPAEAARRPDRYLQPAVFICDEYQTLLRVSRQVDWRFHVVLAHETGHRIGAIRKLRWSDINLEGEVVRWRARHEKTGYEHRTPVTAEAVAALEEARMMSTRTGNAPVLPASRDATRCMCRVWSHRLWSKAQALAGLEPKRGRGWHSLRREFATDLMDQPLKVLCELGGGKNAQTVLKCYQHADEGQIRKALEGRRRVRG